MSFDYWFSRLSAAKDLQNINEKLGRWEVYGNTENARCSYKISWETALDNNSVFIPTPVLFLTLRLEIKKIINNDCDAVVQVVGADISNLQDENDTYSSHVADVLFQSMTKKSNFMKILNKNFIWKELTMPMEKITVY